MSKPPEEGQIWEWRGFGEVSREIATHVESLPIRNGIRDLPGTDVYLIPPTSEQNVKLRLTDRGWVLKFKRLLEFWRDQSGRHETMILAKVISSDCEPNILKCRDLSTTGTRLARAFSQ